MPSKTIFLLLLISFHCNLFGQSKFDSLDFSAVDNYAISVKYEHDVIKLAKDLAGPYTDTIYKVRSIFRWVTDNIEYDYEFVNKGKEVKGPDCSSSVDCSQIRKEWEEDYIKKVLKNKEGVCDGYSRLFKKLCELNNIKCEMIAGYSKNRPFQIGNSLSPNHSWNAVMIGDKWYYLDATWAAGGCVYDEEREKIVKYVKKYKNYYWLTPFNRLARNHYPKNGKWVEQTNLTKEKFFDMPHYYGTEMLEDISNESPESGMLSAKKGDTLHFKFDYAGQIEQLQINTNNFTNPKLWKLYRNVNTGEIRKVKDTIADKKQVYIPFIKAGNTYQFDYVVTENSIYYLDLVFNYEKAMRYKIKIEY